jgi:hypothetical protein
MQAAAATTANIEINIPASRILTSQPNQLRSVVCPKIQAPIFSATVLVDLASTRGDVTLPHYVEVYRVQSGHHQNSSEELIDFALCVEDARDGSCDSSSGECGKQGNARIHTLYEQHGGYSGTKGD